ncbi:MAG: thiamine phosphate synthase [Candidatus Ancillula sp.]|jgi:thiamine-phosphate diphosphorylase|nr:thiamine phosphate synthase [Candidatus Ancillula sp.]
MSRPELDLKLYLIIGRENVPSKTVEEVLQIIKDAVLGGVTTIQLRDKNARDDELLNIIPLILDTIRGFSHGNHVGFLINDRVDIVLEARKAGFLVDGVHLGPNDMNPVEARKLLGEDSVIGVSAGRTTLVELVNQLPYGTVDYIGAGPVHETSSKPDAGVYDGTRIIQGVQGIAKVTELANNPVIAGGGVTPEDIEQLMNAGVCGVFVINYICKALSPLKAAQNLRQALDKYSKVHV